jgi:hypothetical protein
VALFAVLMGLVRDGRRLGFWGAKTVVADYVFGLAKLLPPVQSMLKVRPPG